MPSLRDERVAGAPAPDPRAAHTRRLQVRLGIAAGLLLGGLGVGAGCSLLYELDTNQCNADTDCTGLFGAGYRCGPLHVCLAPPDTGGSGNAGTGGTPGNEPADAGDGGPALECTTNGDCIDKNGDRPFVCRDHACLDLTSDECPFVLGVDNLRSEDPIIIGAYTAIDPQSVTNSVVTANYQMALDEFSTGAPAGGLQNGRRKIAMLACDGVNAGTFSQSLNHLIDVVRVPAVITPLPSSNLVALFDAKAKDSGVFFLSPLDADSSVTNLVDDGLVWNILGSAAALAPTYVPLLNRAEAYVKAHGAPSQIKVALVDDETLFEKDISGVLTGPNGIVFNGKSISDNGANFKGISIPSDVSSANADQLYQQAVSTLNAFQPDIILGIAGAEFVTKIMTPLESAWDEARAARPLYLVSPYQAGLLELHDLVVADNGVQCNTSQACPLSARVLGVNFESARDDSLVKAYRVRFGFKYSQYADNFENFYDAAWYMLYSLAAAGNVGTLTGADVSRGMSRLVRLAPNRRFSIGPGPDPNTVSDVLTGITLNGTNGIELDATMGPPDFDPGSGARNTLGSVFCTTASGDFKFDMLRYNSTDHTLDASPPPSSCIPSGF